MATTYIYIIIKKLSLSIDLLLLFSQAVAGIFGTSHWLQNPGLNSYFRNNSLSGAISECSRTFYKKLNM